MKFEFSFLIIFLGVFADASVDPCRDICDLFSSDRRGAGYDLCDETEEPSRCISGVCTRLFWGMNGNNERGLVYGIHGSGLSSSEISSPLSCADAEDIVAPASTKVINMGVELFTRMSYGRDFIDSTSVSRALMLLRPLAINTAVHRRPDTASLRELLVESQAAEISTVLDTFIALLRVACLDHPRMVRSVYNRYCSFCGSLDFSSSQNSPVLDIDIRSHVNTVDAQSEWRRLVSSQIIPASPCNSCDEITQRTANTRILYCGEVLILRFNRFDSATGVYNTVSIHIPQNLNESDLGSRIPVQYTLFAAIGQTSAVYSDGTETKLTDGYRTSRSPMEVREFSQAEILIYLKQN